MLTPPAEAAFSPKGGTYTAGQAIAFTNLSQNSHSWLWHFGDNGKDTIQNPSHTYGQNGTFNVLLVVTNSAGCLDTAKHTFSIASNVVAIPSAFTPNNDGRNDVLYVRGGPMKEMDFRIYNEWGNELFRSTDQAIGWDGYYKNKLQPAARYIYTLQGTTLGNDPIGMKGEVTIIR